MNLVSRSRRELRVHAVGDSWTCRYGHLGDPFACAWAIWAEEARLPRRVVRDGARRLPHAARVEALRMIYDDFYLEALREVDALTPSCPALAPTYEVVQFVSRATRSLGISADEATARLQRVFGSGPEICGANQVAPGLYVGRSSTSVFGTASDGCPQELHDDGKCRGR